jgi:hypothetical protein
MKLTGVLEPEQESELGSMSRKRDKEDRIGSHDWMVSLSY